MLIFAAVNKLSVEECSRNNFVYTVIQYLIRFLSIVSLTVKTDRMHHTDGINAIITQDDFCEGIRAEMNLLIFTVPTVINTERVNNVWAGS